MTDNNKLENLQKLINKFFSLGFKDGLSAEINLISPNSILINIIGKYAYLFNNNFRLLRDIKKILALMYFNEKDHNLDSKLKILIDVGGQKFKSIESLKTIAKENAEKVILLKRSITLNYMNSFERYIIHDYIFNNYPNLKTHSVGKEPKRRIVISINE